MKRLKIPITNLILLHCTVLSAVYTYHGKQNRLNFRFILTYIHLVSYSKAHLQVNCIVPRVIAKFFVTERGFLYQYANSVTLTQNAKCVFVTPHPKDCETHYNDGLHYSLLL